MADEPRRWHLTGTGAGWTVADIDGNPIGSPWDTADLPIDEQIVADALTVADEAWKTHRRAVVLSWIAIAMCVAAAVVVIVVLA